MPTDPEIVELAREARRSRDFQTLDDLRRADLLPEATRVQSGGFKVRNGVFEALAKGWSRDRRAGVNPAGSGTPVGDWTIDDSGTHLEFLDGADQAVVRFSEGATANALVVDANGLGVGTSTPAKSLHLFEEETPAIRFQQDADGTMDDRTWDVGANEETFFVEDITGATVPFAIDVGAPDDAVVINSDGSIGLGTDAPTTALHIVRSDGSGQILVEDTSATVASRTLFQIQNNGPPRFFLANTDSGETWQFSMSGGDDFQISRVGTGGPEFLIYPDGEVVMGPGIETVFDLAPDGNLEIDGDLTANGMTYSSDRTLKTDVENIDNTSILEKVSELPISSWRFKKEEEGIRHIGPMAQDFYAAFGLGKDSRRINPSDIAGISLSAIQELSRQLMEREAQIQQLQERNQSLEARIGLLSRKLQKIEDQQLAATGQGTENARTQGSEVQAQLLRQLLERIEASQSSRSLQAGQTDSPPVKEAEQTGKAHHKED